MLAQSPETPELSAVEQRAALAEAELRAAEVEIDVLRSRLESLTTLLVETCRQHDAAAHWLEQHRLSLSWKLTEPLRAAKHLAARYRQR